ncbi:MAG TPA: TonB family protein [Rhizomicrobium sp.]
MNGGIYTSSRSDRAASIGFVILLHLVVFWLIAAVRPSFESFSTTRELQLSVFNPHVTSRAPPPPIKWLFQAPEDVVVPQPEITIVSQRGDPDAIVASGAGQVVPPRIDPRHVNTAPDVPFDLRSSARAAVIMLHLLILPDGSVEDAKILKSSRNSDLDRITLDYVKKNWRFLPPSMGGQPIEAWTTAFVRFATPSQW